MGRDGVLGRIDAHLGEVEAGRFRFTLLFGEPGIGKSRLAEAVCEVAQTRGFRSLWAGCRETDGAPPYWPWTQVFRAATGGQADLDALSPVRHTASGGETDRFRLFDTAVRALTDTAQASGPILLVLDDLHRGDDASIELLRFLALTLHEAPILVLGSYRHTDVDAGHPLVQLVGELAGDAAFDVVGLDCLNRTDTALLLRQRANVTDPGRVDALYERTGGNPFFLTEILKLGSANQSTLPVTVEAAIEARLARLPAQTRRILALAAVIGRDFSDGQLARIDGAGEATTRTRLSAAITAGVIAPAQASDGVYRFTHVLVREVLYDALPGPRRTQLHDRVVRDLDNAEPDHLASPVDLATHAVRVLRTPDERLRATRLAVRAAEHAGRRLAHEESAGWLERALDLGTPDDENRFELLLALGRASGRANRVDAAHAAYRNAWALAHADPHAPAARLADVALGLGEAVVSTGTVDPVLVEMLEEALTRADPSDRRTRIRMTARLAAELYWSDRLPAARRLSADAVSAARRLGDPASLAAALAARQVTLRGPDHLDERHRVGNELTRLARRLGDEQAELHARRLLLADRLQIAPELAVAELEQQSLFAERTRLPLARWYLMVSRGVWATMAGRYDDALRTVADTEEFGRRIGAPPAAVYAAFQRFAVLQPMGRAIEVADELRAGIRAFPGVVALRCTLALALAEAEQHDEADALLTDLVAQKCAAVPRDALWLSCLATLTMAAATLDRDTEAATLHTLLQPYSGKIVQQGIVAWWGAVDHYLGLAAGILDHRQLAETALRAGLRLHEAWGAAPQIAASLKALTAPQHRPATSDGLHDVSPSADLPDPLTDREQDVLRLLATGAANKQIARELHISVHTVERHVANLYAKIGVTNRAAATAFALRRR